MFLARRQRAENTSHATAVAVAVGRRSILRSRCTQKYSDSECKNKSRQSGFCAHRKLLCRYNIDVRDWYAATEPRKFRPRLRAIRSAMRFTERFICDPALFTVFTCA